VIFHKHVRRDAGIAIKWCKFLNWSSTRSPTLATAVTHGEASHPVRSSTLLWPAPLTNGRMLPSMFDGVTWCNGANPADAEATMVWRRPPLIKATAAMQGIAEKARRATMVDGSRLTWDKPASLIGSSSESFFMIVIAKPPAPGA